MGGFETVSCGEPLLLPDLPLVGVDIETSGVNPGFHRVIQLGLAVPTVSGLALFSSLVRPSEPMVFDDSAFRVHGIPLDAVLAAPSVEQVAADAVAFLDEFAPADVLLSCGFNVASFDLAFLAADVPDVRARFSHRALELNSVSMFLDGLLHVPHDRLKDLACDYAARRFAADFPGSDAHVHDAGFDAAAERVAPDRAAGFSVERK